MWEEISVVFVCKPMWQNMRACQTIINSLISHINAELLLMSGKDYIMKILHFTLMLVVNINDAASTEIASSVKGTDKTKKCSALRLKKTSTFSPAGKSAA
jgi:hypothetical protein